MRSWHPSDLDGVTRRTFLKRTSAALGGLAALGSTAGCSHPGLGPGARHPRSATVLNGIDVLATQNFEPLQNLRLGLITNHTGHDRHRTATIDLLKNAPGIRLAALFSPEHGIRGEFDENIRDSVDSKTGLPVYSLYGERRAPTVEQLRGLDALVLDIQDIGCRFYTYPSTMALCLQAAAAAGVKFYLLDRVNPINGRAVEGPVHQGGRRFVAFHHVPLRHGLTMGELARMFNSEEGINADLKVIPVKGWSRGEWFDDTGLPWTNPSPNMRSLAAAALYPGIGLHESALSVGRGTERPFEVVGAPYIDELRLVAELQQAELPGVRFLPIRFTPTYSTFKDKPCAGAGFVIVDREKLNAVDLGIAIALIVQRLWPKDFALAKMNTLLQHEPTIAAIREGGSLDEIKRAWRVELDAFIRTRKSCLIY